MTYLILALTVGILFACGAYLLVRRQQIKLILGLGLLSHGVNLLLFSSGKLTLGEPPIFADKTNFLAELTSRQLADPLPQALILTAIVISFGITAFMIVLVNRRNIITRSDLIEGELPEGDPLVSQTQDVEEYDWMDYVVDEFYGQWPLEGVKQISLDVDGSAALGQEGYLRE